MPDSQKRLFALHARQVANAAPDHVQALGELMAQWLEGVSDLGTSVGQGTGFGRYDLHTTVEGREVHIEITDVGEGEPPKI